MSNSEKDWTVPALPTGGKVVNLGYLRVDRVLALYVAYPFDMDKFKFTHSNVLIFSGGAVFTHGICLCEAFRYTDTTRYIFRNKRFGTSLYNDIASKLDTVLEQVDGVSYISCGDSSLESFTARSGIKDASDITHLELRRLVEQIVLYMHKSFWRSYSIHELIVCLYDRISFTQTMETVTGLVKQTQLTKAVSAKFDELVWIAGLCVNDDVDELTALRNKLRVKDDIVDSKRQKTKRKEAFEKILNDRKQVLEATDRDGKEGFYYSGLQGTISTVIYRLNQSVKNPGYLWSAMYCLSSELPSMLKFLEKVGKADKIKTIVSTYRKYNPPEYTDQDTRVLNCQDPIKKERGVAAVVMLRIVKSLINIHKAAWSHRYKIPDPALCALHASPSGDPWVHVDYAIEVAANKIKECVDIPRSKAKFDKLPIWLAYKEYGHFEFSRFKAPMLCGYKMHRGRFEPKLEPALFVGCKTFAKDFAIGFLQFCEDVDWDPEKAESAYLEVLKILIDLVYYASLSICSDKGHTEHVKYEPLSE